MKNKTIIKFCIASVLLCLSAGLPFQAAADQNTFKVGYLEGGEYWLFNRTIESVKEALTNKGWREKINFPEDASFSPGWDSGETAWNQKAKTLMKRDDLDLIIGMGTDATRSLLKKNNHKTPIIGMAVSNALKSGFIKNNNDSGIENFTVRIVPGRYKRMFETFHQVIGFQKLGLIYPDTESGKEYTNLESARKVADNKGFEIIETKIDGEKTNQCFNGLKSLVRKGIDAFFVPSLICFDWEKSDVNKLFKFLRNKNIPTFARNGSMDVKAGALMGFSTIDFSKRGMFLADKMIRILKGTKPSELAMKDNAVPIISINIHVAKEIGFNPPFEVLAATDEIYQRIMLPKERLIK